MIRLKLAKLNGDLQSFYMIKEKVKNEGKVSAKLIPLNNPIQMWLDGLLTAEKIELLTTNIEI